MPDEPILREQAREAIRRGKLPARRSDRMFGGPASGQRCAVCRKPLPREEVEIELEFNQRDGLDQYHFHHRCYAAWEFERTKDLTTPI
jgi:hypothetical protein